MSKWRKRIANVRFAGKTRQTLSAFCLKISEHENEKGAAAKRQLLLFYQNVGTFRNYELYADLSLFNTIMKEKNYAFEIKTMLLFQ